MARTRKNRVAVETKENEVGSLVARASRILSDRRIPANTNYSPLSELKPFVKSILQQQDSKGLLSRKQKDGLQSCVERYERVVHANDTYTEKDRFDAIEVLDDTVEFVRSQGIKNQSLTASIACVETYAGQVADGCYLIENPFGHALRLHDQVEALNGASNPELRERVESLYRKCEEP